MLDLYPLVIAAVKSSLGQDTCLPPWMPRGSPLFSETVASKLREGLDLWPLANLQVAGSLHRGAEGSRGDKDTCPGARNLGVPGWVLGLPSLVSLLPNEMIKSEHRHSSASGPVLGCVQEPGQKPLPSWLRSSVLCIPAAVLASKRICHATAPTPGLQWIERPVQKCALLVAVMEQVLC